MPILETAVNTFDMTMLAYYFDVADGAPMSGEWIAFNQIPGGLFYAQAFQGYSGNELAKVFDNDSEAFIEANESLGGGGSSLAMWPSHTRCCPESQLWWSVG